MKSSLYACLMTTIYLSSATVTVSPEFNLYKIHKEQASAARCFSLDFTDDSSWVPTPSKAKGGIGCEKQLENGMPFVRTGGQGRYGHGVKNAAPIAVKPNTHLTLTFRGRVPDLVSSFIVYIKVYDAAGRDITDTTPPSASWTYSPYSHTHCKYPIILKQANVWQDVALPYNVPDSVHFMDIAVCQWRGTHADCAAVTIDAVGKNIRQKLNFLPESHGMVDGVQQKSWRCPDEALQMTLRISSRQQATAYDLTVTRMPQASTPLALDVEFCLKQPLTGWIWHKNWRQDLPVQADSRFVNGDNVGGHMVSTFPFTAVSTGQDGFAVAIPLSSNAGFESRTVTAAGIISTTPIGFLPHGPQASTASLSWVTYSFDAAWGFRAAAQKFYELYPEAFAPLPSALQEGCWLWPTSPSALPPHAEDFGLAFWEAPANLVTRPKEVAAAHDRGIGIFPYMEPWGMRQRISSGPDNATIMPFDERLKQLKQWASDTSDTTIWFSAPRPVAAQAALNSLPVQPDGTHPFAIDQYDSWAHWWRTNPDPRLAKPNRASICWDYIIQPALDAIDGVYLDSLSYTFAVNYMNTRPEHLAVMKEMLTYDPQTALPCANGMQNQVAFVSWLADKLHPLNKRIFGNIFHVSHRFHAHLIDIFGSEVGSFGGKRNLTEPHSDEDGCVKRFYACHRPVSNLLQEGSFSKPTVELTHEQIAQYIEHQLFYGFYPAITTIGGEEKAGYANWKRYFGPTRQCERERDLFKQVIPIIRQLNQAGWQPVTAARSSNPAVFIERFANADSTFFTIRNTTAAPAETTITFATPLRCKLLYGNGIAIPDALSDTLKLTLPPFRTGVITQLP